MNIQTLLTKAASGAAYNETSSSLVRPSKAGQPLLSLVLTDLVLPFLPQPTPTYSAAKELASAISISTGFVFEAAAVPLLAERYPGYAVEEQPALKWQSFSGRADYLLVSPDKSHVVVVDCKAFGVGTKREILERKLTPGWGYPTQLAIYGMGASELFPSADIELVWCCLAVPTRKVFYISQEPETTIRLANEANDRVQLYTKVKQLLQAGEFARAVDVLVSAPHSEQLPPKGFFYGNPCASAPIHYSPYASLFYPEPESTEENNDGYPLAGEDLRKLLLHLVEDAYRGNTAPYETYIQQLGT